MSEFLGSGPPLPHSLAEAALAQSCTSACAATATASSVLVSTLWTRLASH